jgi:hypothetical protein
MKQKEIQILGVCGDTRCLMFEYMYSACWEVVDITGTDVGS